jgi:hypothetical protein
MHFRASARALASDRVTPSSLRESLQFVSPQPVPHGRLAATNRLGDLCDRHPGLDQRFELAARQRALRCVLPTPDRFKTVPPDPIRNRRFVPVKAPSDLGQRQALAQ